MKITATSVQQARKFEAYLREMGVPHTAWVGGVWKDNANLVFANRRHLKVRRIPSDHVIVVDLEGEDVSLYPHKESIVKFICEAVA